MRKRDWFWVIASVVLVWAVDQLTKLWALKTLGALTFHGPIGLVLHRNPGAILGTFAELPPILRVVSLSTGGAFLIFIAAAIQYLLPGKLMKLRIGISFLLGGILGNVTDRIIGGSVVDFLLFGQPSWMTPAFNFADAIQWVGYGMVVYTLIREGHQLWPDANARKKVWINPKFQLKYCMILMSIGLAYSIIAGVFSYTYLRVTIEDIVVGSPQIIEQRFLYPFLQVFGVIAVGFIVMLFVIGRLLSHRTAGPVYAFEKYLEDLLQGKDRGFRVRAGDEFGHLEALAKRLRTKLQDDYKRKDAG